MLEIKDLWVSIGGKNILRGVNLSIGKKETHVLMGPNASGKTTLVLSILGYPSYQIRKGAILFDGKDLSRKSISERSKIGIAVAYQNPPEIRGVKLRDLLRLIGGKEPWNPLLEPEEKFATHFLKRVNLNPNSFLTRDLNLGFSGGERKRSELTQVFAMKPKLMILDEPDSGVDIDSVRLIGLELNKVIEEIGCSLLVITHHRHILQYLQPDHAHIMYGGKIIISGYPDEIIQKIEQIGYESYVKEIGV